MASTATFATVAALAGDPARAGMLHALMDGRALTASELARAAGVTAQTASGHLARMTSAGLVCVEKQGRHRYHRLASPDVAHMMETIMQVASTLEPSQQRRLTVGPRDAALRAARTCYDHLAGRLGVAVTQALVARGVLHADDHGFALSAAAPGWLGVLDIDLDRLRQGRRAVTRQCQDWSERRPHLAGALGAAIADRFLEQGWIRRDRDSRAVALTEAGRAALARIFGPEILDQATAA
jgi:DNA-binding transcriptional ArsR family regulator